MIKSTIFFAALLLLSSAQNCDNPVADALEITLEADPVTLGSNVEYCPFLADSDDGSCCSADTLQEVADKVEELKDTLQTMAGERDRKLAKAFTSIRSNMEATMDAYSEIFELDIMQQAGVDEGEMGEMDQFMEEFEKGMKEAREAFTDFQSNRAQCYREMLDIQASAICLACNPNWETQGVDEDGEISIAEGTCARITESCFVFAQ
mmetsp:Transcript_30355/g.27613  ORF Transcript_30355/g.27613 Transcript_30355/m.27613 type:complete len:207 (+) Transcript_30355:56-676(+)